MDVTTDKLMQDLKTVVVDAEDLLKATASQGGEQIARTVFEARPGGIIYEEHLDGRRFKWGTVREIQRPALVGERRLQRSPRNVLLLQ